MLVVVDDMIDEADERLTRIFMCGSHHRKVSVIFMVQNFFNKNRYMTTISLNAEYLVLFKNPCDSSQFVHLAKQLYPPQCALCAGSVRRYHEDMVRL